MEGPGVGSVGPPADGAVAGLLPHTDGVVLGLEVSAGLGRTPRPVVEGGHRPRGPSQVLQAPRGRQPLGPALDHGDQDVPGPLTGPGEAEGQPHLVGGELSGLQVEVVTRVEPTDGRSVVSRGGPGPLNIQSSLTQNSWNTPGRSPWCRPQWLWWRSLNISFNLTVLHTEAHYCQGPLSPCSGSPAESCRYCQHC